MYKVCAVVFNERSGHAGLTFSLALILYMSLYFMLVRGITSPPQGGITTLMNSYSRDISNTPNQEKYAFDTPLVWRCRLSLGEVYKSFVSNIVI